MAALDPVKIITLPDGSSYDIVDGTLTAGTGIQISNRDSSTGKRTISANINVGVTDVKVGNQSVVESGVAKLKGAANKDIASNTGSSADSGKVPVLDANGKLDTNVLPAIAITDTFTAASETAMLALSAQKGDVCVRTDISKTYILTATPASTKANWQELLFPADAVSSVNGKTGVVTLSASDVGAATDDHTHTISLATDSGTSAVSLAANTKYKLTAGGNSVIFTTPAQPTVNNATLTIQKNGTDVATFTANSSTNQTANISVPTKVSQLTNDSGFITTEHNQTIKCGSTTFGADAAVDIVAGDNVSITSATTGTGAPKITIAATDTTYESKTAVSGGTDVSLVTTGEKYTWNSKAAGNHTHNSLKNGNYTASLPTLTANSTLALTSDIPTKTSDLTNDRFIRYDLNAQGLNDTQKSNARTNIGAGTSNLAIGTTATTAAAGNHNHNGTYLTSVTSDTQETGGIEYIEAVSYDSTTGTLTLGRKYLHNNK